MANLSEVLLRRQGHGALCTGADSVDEDLASVHALHDFDADGSPKGTRGLPQRTITELSGLPGSGKTAITLALILETVRTGLNVLYVGCDFRSFPWERARAAKGWKAERFDSRVHTVYISEIDQLLALRAPHNTGLVVVEHYDTLIKRAWSAAVSQRAAEACICKFRMFSQGCSVLATAGCIRTRRHEHVVLGPAVKIWNRPINMARLLIYQTHDLGHILSTGACFKLNSQGLISEQREQRGPGLSLPTLSARKAMQMPQTKKIGSPKTAAPHGLLTPASKRAKLGISRSAPLQRDNAGREDVLSASPSYRRSRPMSADVRCREELSLPSLTPVSTASSQPSSQSGSQPGSQPCRLSGMQSAAQLDRRDEASHTISQTLDQKSPEPKDPKQIDAPPPRAGDSFLGLEIVPNSQVDASDPEYSLHPSFP